MPLLFYHWRSSAWCHNDQTKPEEGDLRKTEQGIYYKFDGCQWRRQCRYCTKFTRPTSPHTCQRHNGSAAPLVNSSNISCQFLDLLSEALGVAILHQCRHTFATEEYTIPGTRFRVDGLIEGTKIVIEILGGFWHGGGRWQQGWNKVTQTKFETLRQQTWQRLRLIERQGFQIFYVWDYEITKWLKTPEPSSPVTLLHRFDEKSG